MKLAIAAVQGGHQSVRKASDVYNVPRSSLQRRLSFCSANEERPIKPKLGRKASFAKEDELKLVDFACNRAQMGVGIGKRQFMKFAADLARKRKVSFKKGTPSEKWWRLMKTRHSQLVRRKPEATATVRHRLMNKEYVMKYFKALEKVMTEHSFQPSHIWNMDESGVQLEHRPR